MRARRPRRRLAAACAVAAALAACGAGFGPAAALANDAGSVTHTAGAVTATLEWDGADGNSVANPRLSITRDGTRYDLTIVDICAEGCILVPDDAERGAGSSIVKVVDLDGDGDPEVLVDVFSGGAHCCTTTRAFTWDGTGYQPADIEWADAEYAVQDADGDGRPELVGQDASFAYAFTSYADSAFPPLVRQVDHGQVTDVTRRFPKVVRANASRLLKALRKAGRGSDVRGVLAAYVADEYLLGRGGSIGKAEIEHQRAKGRVSKGFGPLLLKRLKTWGYR